MDNIAPLLMEEFLKTPASQIHSWDFELSMGCWCKSNLSDSNTELAANPLWKWGQYSINFESLIIYIFFIGYVTSSTFFQFYFQKSVEWSLKNLRPNANSRHSLLNFAMESGFFYCNTFNLMATEVMCHFKGPKCALPK